MKIRAAVAWEAGRELSIEEIDLEGPREGECLVRIAATSVSSASESCATAAVGATDRNPNAVISARKASGPSQDGAAKTARHRAAAR